MLFFFYGCHDFTLILCAVWCRRTDELVDGPNASHITPMALDRWEARLEDLFHGRAFDMLDAALADTVTRYPVDIQVSLSLSLCLVQYILIRANLQNSTFLSLYHKNSTQKLK